jgi:hypothetical protein
VGDFVDAKLERVLCVHLTQSAFIVAETEVVLRRVLSVAGGIGPFVPAIGAFVLFF